MENANGASNNGSEGLNPNKTSSPESKFIEITITLHTHAYFISGIRDFTLNLIKNTSDFSEQWAYRFQSIVDELCNNAIEHGSKEGDAITIVFQNEPSKYIQIYVEDKGNGSNPMNADEINKIVEARKKESILNGLIRGRGLPKIVAEWSDELEFTNLENKGIKVRVKKFLNDPKTQANISSGLDNPTHIVLN
jgi:anti-sigma regulatory factor (Ser/Thr protein kinase)